MAERTLAESIKTEDGTSVATITPEGLLIEWEILDEVGLTEAYRDKGDSVWVALLKVLAREYPVSARDGDKTISITAIIAPGTPESEFDSEGNETRYSQYTLTAGMFHLEEPVSLDPSKFGDD